jgi:tRNA threonylcarbamoyladenosine biosynthesis protein TsaB
VSPADQPGPGAGTRNSLRVLAIDTSTEACSAALLLADGTIALRCTMTERSHADLILPMIDELLRESGLRLAGLDGLAFGRGPGSFTGLRVAAGVIQGLAFGANLPVAPVSSLAAVAWQAMAQVAVTTRERPAADPGPDQRAGEEPHTGAKVLVCNDARMNEVYWGCFQAAAGSDPHTLVALTPEHVGPAAAILVPGDVRHCAGNAFVREPELLARLEAAGLTHHAGLYPRADAIARMGAMMLQRGLGVSAADALPVYVRDSVTQVAKPPVTGMS